MQESRDGLTYWVYEHLSQVITHWTLQMCRTHQELAIMPGLMPHQEGIVCLQD